MEHDRNYGKDQTPGALGLGQVKSTRIYCAFFILYFITPVFIAPLADSRLGQYKTLLGSLFIYCLGCIALVVTSLPANLERGWGVPGLGISLVLIGLGGGGVGNSRCWSLAANADFKQSQATMRSFIANQYTDRTVKKITLGSGELVRTCPEITLKYIYSLYFWVGNVGALLAFATVNIERQQGFTPAFGLGLGCLIIAILILILGKNRFGKRIHFPVLNLY
jgi:POT family proton-dependent oligopeptide transporter